MAMKKIEPGKHTLEWTQQASSTLVAELDRQAKKNNLSRSDVVEFILSRFCSGSQIVKLPTYKER